MIHHDMHPPPELLALVTTYGYPAVFLGAVFEGETTMILSGLFAHQGLLSLFGIILLAYIGTVIGDGMWFLVSRYRFPRALYESAWFKRLAARPVKAINGDPEILALTMRFLYGFRTLIPLGLGLSNISIGRFFALHSIGAIVWISLYVSIGFFFGRFLETLFGRIKYGELLLIATVMVTVVVFLGIAKTVRYFLRRKLQS